MLGQKTYPFGLHGYHKGGDGGAAQIRADEEARNTKIRQATQDINFQFDGRPAMDGKPAVPGFDNAYFDNVADAYLNFQKPLLEEQATVARRGLPTRFASTSNSAYQREAGNLERDYARELANLSDKALDFSNKQRGDIEGNRADLIGMANSGTDSAALASQTAARVAALQKPPAYSPIADLFSRYAPLAGNQATAYAYGQANQAQNPLHYGAPKNSVKFVSQ